MGQEISSVGEQYTTVSNDQPSGVFVGTYVHKLDPKNRLTIPSDWREVVGKTELYLMPGLTERCLVGMSAHEMGRRSQAIRRASIADEKARPLARFLGGQVNRVSWDSQGRILVGDDMLKHAGITGEVVLVGTFETFELWSPEQWKQQQEFAARLNLGEAARSVGF